MSAETEARAVVKERSNGICEVCGHHRAREWHHRKNRSQGGAWCPSNGLHACSSCHRYITEHPTFSYEKGWAVRSYQDPESVAVWTFYGWRLLAADGSYSQPEEDRWPSPTTQS